MKKTVIKGKKGQQLNQREARLIHDMAVEGLLLFNAESKNNSITLTYNTDGLIRLHDFLQLNEMGMRLFLVMMRNIVIALKSMEEHKFSKNLIEWDTRTSYVDPSSWHIYLMYVPLQPYETSGTLRSYLQEIVSLCNFTPGEDLGYVQELVKELNASVAYTVYMLEAYCDRFSKQLFLKNTKQHTQRLCPSCSAKLMSDETICPFCGVKIRTVASGVIMASHPGSHLQNENGLDPREGGQMDSPPRTVSISEDENGVVTIFKSSRTIQSVWLEDRERVGKIIVIKFPFRIGKMEGVTDYRIFNNNVSRKHADILKENGKYFLVDLGSTNGTYINGKRLQAGVKEELSDGSKLRFADAEFKFHID